jgi:hypothetical protein
MQLALQVFVPNIFFLNGGVASLGNGAEPYAWVLKLSA